MRNPLRGIGNVFKSPATANLETANAALDAAEQELAAADAAIRAVPLSVRLSDDRDAVMGPLRERKRRAEENVNERRDDLADAQRAEKDRQASDRRARETARRNRIKTDGTALVKIGERFRGHAEALITADYRDAVKVAERMYNEMTPHERREAFGTTRVKDYIDRLVRLEISRISGAVYPTADGCVEPPQFPGATLLGWNHPDLPYATPVRSAKPIDEQFRDRFVSAANMIGNTQPPPSPAPEPERPTDAPAEGGGGHRPSNATIRGSEHPFEVTTDA